MKLLQSFNNYKEHESQSVSLSFGMLAGIVLSYTGFQTIITNLGPCR